MQKRGRCQPNSLISNGNGIGACIRAGGGRSRHCQTAADAQCVRIVGRNNTVGRTGRCKIIHRQFSAVGRVGQLDAANGRYGKRRAVIAVHFKLVRRISLRRTDQVGAGSRPVRRHGQRLRDASAAERTEI